MDTFPNYCLPLIQPYPISIYCRVENNKPWEQTQKGEWIEFSLWIAGDTNRNFILKRELRLAAYVVGQG